MTFARLTGASLLALACATGAGAQSQDPRSPAGVPQDATVEDIVVTGQRGAQARAIDAKREAIGILDVSAADEIGRLPDRNVAEVIERLPGVGVLYDQGEGRYISIRGVPSALNNYTINGFEIGNPDGQTRMLPLDIISGQLLNRVEVIKAKTADLDGQGIGGTVNLVIQTAFDFQDRFVVQANAQAGYQELNDKVPVRGDLSVGGRFGADEQFGVLVGGSYSRRTYQSFGLYPDDWREVPGAARGGLPIDIKHTDYELTRERIGAIVSLDYRPSEDHQFYVRGLYSRFTEDEYRQRYRLDFATVPFLATAQARLARGLAPGFVLNPDGYTGTVTPTAAVPGTPTTAIPAIAPEQRQDLRLEYKEKSVLTGMVGGQDRFGRLTLDYALSRVRNEVIEPNRLWQFRGNPTTPVDFDFTSVYFTAAPRVPLTANELQFRQYSEQDENGDERIWQGRADLRYDLGGDAKSWLKVGVKYRSTNKDFDAENTVYTRGATAATRFTLGQFNLQGEPVLDYSKKGKPYLNTPTIDADAIKAFTDQQLGGPLFVLDSLTTRVNGTIGDLDLREKVAAGYATANIDLGGVTVTPGVRVERTKLDIRGFALTNGTTVTPVDRANRRTNWLPSLIVRAEPRSDVVLRAAYTRSIGRPEYLQLSPGGSINSVDQTATLGNPDLKPYISDALDASAEWYFARGGLLSVGVFGKWIKNPIFTQTTTLLNVDYAGQLFPRLQFSQPQNAEKGEIRGVEFAYQQQFTFLPGLLSGFGVEANLTLTDSELTVPGRARKLGFQGQADVLYGVQLFYQRGRVEASVAFHSTDSFLAAIGANPVADQYSARFERLDAKASFAVTPNISIYAEAQNLTDEPTGFYQNKRTDWIIQRERYGRTYYAGVSAKF